MLELPGRLQLRVVTLQDDAIAVDVVAHVESLHAVVLDLLKHTTSADLGGDFLGEDVQNEVRLCS